MKKVILTGVALMGFAAASFAQNTSTLDQNGTGQSGTINQTGKFQTATVQQSGVGNANNFGTVIQISQSTQTGIITQNGGAINNQAYINQTDLQPGAGSSDANTAIISQNTGSTGGSSTNTANIAQSGRGATATTEQNNYSFNNQAYIQQALDGYGSATIRQNGGSGGGTYSGYQTGSINQSGGSHSATIDQSDYSALNQSYITQIGGGVGSGSSAFTTQNRTSARNYIQINQSDSYNVGVVDQSDYSFDNQTYLTQTGQGNSASIIQSQLSEQNLVQASQSGYASSVTVEQQNNSNDNKAYVNQAGYYNQINVLQNASQGSVVTINQDVNTTGGLFNLVEVTQTGNAQQAIINQDYSVNTIRLLQENGAGSGGNFANLSQTGDYNVIQDVAGSGGFALQSGTGNSLTISQNSGASAPYVANVANVSQIGTGNIGVITQVGGN